jgi:glucosamine-phosphate N-acetyltransferase
MDTTVIQSVKKMQSEEEKLIARILKITDKKKGFIELLQQLSSCDSVSEKEFEDRFKELDSVRDDHVFVLLRMRFLERLLQRGVCLLRNCGKV